jgi:predicted alpha/beta-hydrolase family hydrolase
MRHPFMADVAAALAARGIATARWELPYMAAGRARPDSPAVCEAAVRAVCAAARERWPDLRIVAGGKSFGGRMTSNAIANGAIPGVERLAFAGFPLHPAGAPAITRAEHLARVGLPMLFLWGTRDDLAVPELLRPVVTALPTATLVELAGADHGFEVLRRSSRTNAQVIDELADALARWLGPPHP